MVKFHTASEMTGGKPEERDPIPVFWVHIGLYFEDETADFVLERVYVACLRGLRLGWRGHWWRRAPIIPGPQNY